MSFSYDITQSRDLDKIRFHINDVTQDSGPRPADANFEDEEITAVLSSEGTWQLATAAMFERLSAEWARHPTFQADGFSISRSHIARHYREEGDMWRKRWSKGGKTSMPAGSRVITRVDAYSSDIDATTTDSA